MLIVTGHNRRDGTFVPDSPRPEPCVVCGEVPEELLVSVEELVGSDGKIMPYDD
jgi:hypothetical protein